MVLKRGIVKLVEYDSNWKKEYEREEKLLKEVLGNIIIEIHHIGSTSIESLKAKPIIDILIVINSLNEINKIEKLLKPFNYENKGNQGVLDRYFFVKGQEDVRSHYIHFVELNSKTYYNQVYFKKYLIEHPEYIKKYSDLKQELAKKYEYERSKYTLGKNEFITSVINLAKEEYNK